MSVRNDDRNQSEQDAVENGVRFTRSVYQRNRRRNQTSRPRSQQKRKIKQNYAAKKRREIQALLTVRKHRKGAVIVCVILLAFLLYMSIISGCSVMAQGGLGVVKITTFPSSDEALLAADEAYSQMEDALAVTIENYEQNNTGYDEYRYSVGSIGHDPYVLVSILSAKYGGFTLTEVQATLETLFSLQYTLNESVSTEVITGKDGTEYEYSVCYVILTVTALDDIAGDVLTEEQQTLYSVYIETKGNKPNLF